MLSHLGTFVDEVLAEEIPEIDIIISAHDHKLFPEAKIINNTIINSAGNYGEHVGVLEVEVESRTITLLRSESIATQHVEKDAEILSILGTNKEKAIRVLSQPLYTLHQPLWHDVVEENPLTNLIADGLRDMLQCDIGLINSGICNAGIFHDVSKKKLIEVCPSPLNPTYFEIQGKFLKAALQQSLDSQKCLEDGRGPGFRGRFLGKLHISGGEVVHDGKEIIEVRIGGRVMEEESWYSVSSSDYLQRGSGYESLANNRNAKYFHEEIKDVIRMYADQNTFAAASYENRWKNILF